MIHVFSCVAILAQVGFRFFFGSKAVQLYLQFFPFIVSLPDIVKMYHFYVLLKGMQFTLLKTISPMLTKLRC